MSTTTFSGSADDMQGDQSYPHAQTHDRGEPALIIQILSILAFGAFSIVGIALAFSAHWIAGLVIAVVIAKTWAGSRMFGGHHNWHNSCAGLSISDLAPAMSKNRSSGNSSFDAHRAEMLQRLEQESRDFEDFLARLRQASDATEFDQFMDDRATAARDTD